MKYLAIRFYGDIEQFTDPSDHRYNSWVPSDWPEDCVEFDSRASAETAFPTRTVMDEDEYASYRAARQTDYNEAFANK